MPVVGTKPVILAVAESEYSAGKWIWPQKVICAAVATMPVWRGEGDFQALLKKDADVKKYLSDAEIDEQFDLGYHFKHVDTIFKRVFGQS